ncbi:hypothetical protein O181_052860 [Austropuccinia psidii MF-1]|uniref:Lipoprotein n=1 Tax=Austropuccinia psidii MF-1 TaxID=1389203 RepID=A0A9Q3HT19_9BASI|nr:hypothetical protein [Austropuccinia psidii MF-1]
MHIQNKFSYQLIFFLTSIFHFSCTQSAEKEYKPLPGAINSLAARSLLDARDSQTSCQTVGDLPLLKDMSLNLTVEANWEASRPMSLQIPEKLQSANITQKQKSPVNSANWANSKHKSHGIRLEKATDHLYWIAALTSILLARTFF